MLDSTHRIKFTSGQMNKQQERNKTVTAHRIGNWIPILRDFNKCLSFYVESIFAMHNAILLLCTVHILWVTNQLFALQLRATCSIFFCYFHPIKVHCNFINELRSERWSHQNTAYTQRQMERNAEQTRKVYVHK